MFPNSHDSPLLASQSACSGTDVNAQCIIASNNGRLAHSFANTVKYVKQTYPAFRPTLLERDQLGDRDLTTPTERRPL